MNRLKIGLLTLLLSACGTAPADRLSTLFPVTETPPSARLPIGTDAIREPVLLLGADSLLICTNRMTNKLIRVYRLSDGRWNDLVSMGRAENEMIDASSIWISDDALHVYGVNSGKILRIPLNQLFSSDPVLTVAAFPRGFFSLSPRAGRGGYVVSAGLTANAADQRFALLDSAGKRIGGFGSYRELDSRAAERELPMIYQGKLATNGDGTKAAYASSLGSVIQFFDLSDPHAVRLAKDYRFALPTYLSDSDPAAERYAVRWDKDCVAGALAVAAARNGFFVLCDEEKLISDKDWRMSTVYLFDWDGHPLRKFDLGRKVQTIAVDEAGDRLYALAVDDDEAYSFVAYEL